MKHRAVLVSVAAVAASALLLGLAPAAPAQDGDPLDSIPVPVLPEQVEGRPAPVQAESPGCHPNYRPCVPNDPVDVDCNDGTGDGPSFVEGPVQVIGVDEYGLDANEDGVG
jgi:hypothetical protein